ncbi:MAG: hypothetical protein ACR2NY_06735 [Alphaproteobacteria bacterium]
MANDKPPQTGLVTGVTLVVFGRVIKWSGILFLVLLLGILWAIMIGNNEAIYGDLNMMRMLIFIMISLFMIIIGQVMIMRGKGDKRKLW